jgi:hypothetical protein
MQVGTLGDVESPGPQLENIEEARDTAPLLTSAFKAAPSVMPFPTYALHH